MREDAHRDPREMGSRWWLLLLAGPVIWYLHFWFVYLLAEWICSLTAEKGTHLLLGAVAAATAVAVLAILVVARHGRSDEPAELALVNRVQVVVFVLGVVMVAAPAAVFAPC